MRLLQSRVADFVAFSARACTAGAVVLAVTVFSPRVAPAVDYTWTGSSNASWRANANWLPNTGFPGFTSGSAVFNDSATFNGAGNGNTTINLGSGTVSGTSILFTSSNAAAYTIGSGGVNAQTLMLSTVGGGAAAAVTMNSDVVQDQTFNATIILGTDVRASTYTFTNNSLTNSLILSGSLVGGYDPAAPTATPGLKSLIFTGAGRATVGGDISWRNPTLLGVTKSGNGILTLSGSNSYTGGTTVNAGMLEFVNRMSFLSGSTSSWTGAALTTAASGTSTFYVGGAGQFTASDIAVISSQTLFAAAGANLGLNTTNAGGNFDMTSPIANAGNGARVPNVVKLGSGNLTLSAANTFSGTLSVQSGTVVGNNANALAAATVALVDTPGSTLDVSGLDQSIGTLVGGGTTGGTVAIGSRTLTIGANSVSGTFLGGFDTSTGNIVKSGYGVQTLGSSLATTFASTTLSQGQLVVAPGGSNTIALGTLSRSAGDSLVVTPGSGSVTATVTLASGLVGPWALTGSGTNLRYLTTSGGTLVAASATGTAANAASLPNDAAANFDLTTGTGATPATVSANTVRYLGGTGTTAPGASFTVNGLMNSGTGTWTIGSANPITIGSTSELVVATNTNAVVISSAIQNNGANPSVLTFASGGGNLTLGGANTFSGDINVAGGSITLAGGTAYQNVNLAGNSLTGTVASGTMTIVGINSGGGGTFTKQGAGTILLTGTSNYTGNTTITTGTLVIGPNAVFNSRGTITNTATTGLVFQSVVSQTWTGGGLTNLTKSGPGTLTLVPTAASQSFTALNVSSGTLAFGGSAFTSQTLSGTIGSGATVNLLGYGEVTAGAITINGGLLQLDANAQIASANAAALTSLTLAGGTVNWLNGASYQLSVPTINATSGTSVMSPFSWRTSGVQGTITVSTGATLLFSGANTGATSAGIIKNGGGLLVMNATQATQVATVINAGTMQQGTANSFGSTGQGLTVNGGVADLNGFALTSGVLTGSAGTVITSGTGGAATYTMSSASSGTFAGVMQDGSGGRLSFTKASTGTQTLTGANTYTGTTTVSGGVLALSGGGSLASSPNAALVLSGGQLDLGTTSLSVGAVTISATAAVNPIVNGSLSGTAYSATFASGTATVAINLGGSGGLAKTGAGTFVLSGSNSFSGGATLGGGVLSLGNANALPASGTMTFTGGTLQYAAAGIPDYSGLIANSTGAISLDTNGQNATWASPLAATNTGGLTKLGSGTLTITGSNLYSGATTINGGALVVGTSGTTALGASTNPLALNGGTLDLGGRSITVGLFTGSAGSTITSSQAGAMTFTASSASSGTYGGSITNG
ncbi:MAG: autotransporter-associated beta strand repeat-containing protein, partial [Pirellulales bacterium]